MSCDDFVRQVQHRCRLPSQGDAVAAIQATLETLAERVTVTEAKDLASQLPRQIGGYLAPQKPLERFGLDEFFKRVSDREHVNLPVSVYHARVAVEVLGEAVSAGELADVRVPLPAEFAPLFDAGSQGPLKGGGKKDAASCPVKTDRKQKDYPYES